MPLILWHPRDFERDFPGVVWTTRYRSLTQSVNLQKYLKGFKSNLPELFQMYWEFIHVYFRRGNVMELGSLVLELFAGLDPIRQFFGSLSWHDISHNFYLPDRSNLTEKEHFIWQIAVRIFKRLKVMWARPTPHSQKYWFDGRTLPGVWESIGFERVGIYGATPPFLISCVSIDFPGRTGRCYLAKTIPSGLTVVHSLAPDCTLNSLDSQVCGPRCMVIRRGCALI